MTRRKKYPNAKVSRKFSALRKALRALEDGSERSAVKARDLRYDIEDLLRLYDPDEIYGLRDHVAQIANHEALEKALHKGFLARKAAIQTNIERLDKEIAEERRNNVYLRYLSHN